MKSSKGRKKDDTWKKLAHVEYIPKGMISEMSLELQKRKEGPDLPSLDNPKRLKITEDDCNETGTAGTTH